MRKVNTLFNALFSRVSATLDNFLTPFNALPLKNLPPLPVSHALQRFVDPFAGSGGFQLGACPFMVARGAASRGVSCVDMEPSEMARVVSTWARVPLAGIVVA